MGRYPKADEISVIPLENMKGNMRILYLAPDRVIYNPRYVPPKSVEEVINEVLNDYNYGRITGNSCFDEQRRLQGPFQGRVLSTQDQSHQAR